MLESLVVSILNRFLKNYVSNLNYDQLKIGIWKGEVHLRNLKLRKDALDKLHLPINVSEGYLGEITLIIPWSNLRSEPVKVIIDQIYLLAEPKNEATVTVEEEEERAQQLKRRRLDTAELLESAQNQQQEQKDTSNNKNDGFISQLTTKVIDNLQFTLKNVHIRYEDKLSDVGHTFAVGITLKELSALSTDDNWNPKFISEPTSSINKLAALESLAVYWNTETISLAGMHPEEASQVFTDLIPTQTNSIKDHQYILKPVSGTGKIKLNKIYGDNVPKTDVTLLFDEIAFGLDDHQYRDAILMIDLFHANLKKQKYLKFHPGKGKTPKSNPKEYIQFAGKAILSEIHQKNYRWSWDSFKTRRDQRLKYVECYVVDKLKKATPAQLKELEKLELDLSFEDIRFYRSIAKSKLKREQVRIDKENEKKKIETAKAGWWGWIRGVPASDSSSSNDDDDASSIHMTEEQKKELYDAIDFDEDKARIASAIDIPKDTIKFALKTKLNRGSFTLKQNVKKKNETDIVSIVFDTVSADVTQYTESMKVEAALGDLQLFDGTVKDTIYPQLIGVKKRKNNLNTSLLDVQHNMNERERRASDAMIDLSEKKAEPFFSVVFEKKPLDNRADNAISLKMRHLEIIHSPQVIDGIIQFFKPPSSKMESVNALIAVAGDTFEELRLQTRAGLDYALETHTTLDVNIDMDAPIIIIPESLTSQDSSVIIIDAGHINIDSQFADKNVLDDIKNKDITKYDERDVQTLESLMYDKFNLQLSQTKVLIGENTKECLWQLQNNNQINGVDNHLIERIDMNFLIEICILPGKTEFTKIKVSGHLPLLSVNISDVKYKTFMKILDLALPKTENEPVQATQPVNRPLPTETSTNNILSDRIWGSQSNEILLYDSASDMTSEAGESTASTLYTPHFRSIDPYEVEQFKLTFKVDKVSALVFESAESNDKPDILLCELVLESFELVVVTRPNDILVDVSLKSLGVLDKINPTDNFPYLVTSEIIDKHRRISRANEKDLINIKYRKASKEHPQFQNIYECYDQTVDVTLSTLTVIVTRKSLLALYNWIMKTFTSPPTLPIEDNEDNESNLSNVLPFSKSNTNQKENTVQANGASNDSRMKVAIHMDSINLILNQEGLRLGTVKLSVGDIIIKLEPTTLEVNGRFGDFSLSDDTELPNEGSHDMNSPSSETHIISIVGDELADFTYKTYDPNSSKFPDYNQMFMLKMGAIQLLLTDSLKPTLNFLQEFLEMKGVYDAARNAAMQSAQQYQESADRFHFDIVIKSPVLIIPGAEDNSTDRLIANLGEIRAKNEFVKINRRHMKNIMESTIVPVTHINCGLYNINLRSITRSLDGSEQLLPIINNVNISFDIDSLENPKEATGPISQMNGNISDIRMSLTEKQYKSLLEAWYFIQKTFLAVPETDEENTSTSEELSVFDKNAVDSSRSQLSVKSSARSTASPNVIDQVKINLNFVLKLNLVCLEIMNGDFNDNNKEDYMLSKLTFDNIGLKLQTMSDESMVMEVIMESMNFTDSRAQSKSKFKDILPANALNGPQFQFKLQTSIEKNVPKMDMTVTVDSPKIILSLDYLFLLKDFFMAPFIVVEPTEAQKYAQAYGDSGNKKQQDAKQLQHQNQPPATVMTMKFIIVDPKVICLSDPENEASEAVVLSLNHVTVIQKESLDVKLDNIRMVLCRMDNIQDSMVYFVEEFDISLVMKTTSDSVHNLTTINLDVQPINLRLSYQDAMLIMNIINKVIALLGTESANTAPKPIISDSDSEINSINSHLLASDDDNASNHVHLNAPITVPAPEKPKTIEPYIIMSNESLIASFDGIQIVLLENTYDLPFMDIHIKPFVMSASDWSRAIQANVDFELKANYFNFKNSHWEPLIEPWSFGINVAQEAADMATEIIVSSNQLLYLNASHAFIEMVLAVSETLSQTKLLSTTAQAQVKPYMIKNNTGYNIHFWNMSDDIEKGDNRTFKLANGESLPWTFRDSRKRRHQTNLGSNLLGVKIEKCDWENVIHITVDKESQQTYLLRPTHKGVYHRLVVDIQLENNVKIVTFRSGLIVENKSTCTMQVAMVNHERKFVSEILNLKPYEIYNVPILLAYNRWIVVRPSESYHWSNLKLNWADVFLSSTPKCIECLPFEDNTEHLMQWNYQVNAIYDKQNPVVKKYPFMKIQFCPPVEVENLLPFGFDVAFTEDGTNNKVHSFIEKGETSHIHNLKSTSSLVFKIDLKTDHYNCSNTTIISTAFDYSSTGEKIVIMDQKNVPITLRMIIKRKSNTSDALIVSIFAPYLIINKTGLPIGIRQRQTYRQGRIPIKEVPAYEEGEVMEPIIFSYPDINHHNRAQISINGSKWSDPISFEAVGNTQDIRLFSETDSYARHAGIRVEEGLGILKLSKIVTITPRFILKNNMDVNLEFREFGDSEATKLDSGQKMALYQTSKSNVRWLCLQIQGLENDWSSPFDIQEIGKTFVKVEKGDGSVPYLVRVSVHIKESTIFVTFNEDEEWPYFIVNKSNVPVRFKQEDISVEDYDLKDKQKDSFRKPRMFTLLPGEILKYSWDIPVAKEKRLELHVEERRRAINFQAIGAQVPFRYKKHRDGPINSYTMSIDVVAVHSALVLRLTDFDLEKSLYRPKSSGASTLASSSKEGSLKEAFETVNIQHVINYSFILNLAGIGLSVINRNAEELAFATIKGLNFKYTDSNMYQSLRFSIQWLQIDNQLFGSTYPILCYPTTLPKVSNELAAHPTLHIALEKVKDDKHGVLYFKLFSILLQEMTFEIDEDFLYALLDFAQFENTEENNKNINDMFTMTVEEPVVDQAQALYYFEEFCIQPMRLNLSFVRTEKIAHNPTEADKSSAVGYVFNVFTMTLGNINDAPIKLNALIVDNLRSSSEDLTNRIMLHYREQIIYQIHRVLGSIDILGNPVGLFNTLSSGFGELFYEPYQGFIMSDRPQDLGIGIAKGVGGFVKKGVFGISDSMSRFTGSLGKGISAATMDKKFQDRRRMNMTRNKPKHAIYGVTQGFGYFGTSVASGVAGLVKRPIEGAEAGGISGFAEGIARGVVGAFTKPVVGFFDMASNIAAGVRETTTVFEGDINPERIPRYTSKDGIIVPYSQREALGQLWLKEADSGRHLSEIYIAHSLLKSDKMVAILTHTQILVIRSDTLKLDYYVHLNSIQSAEATTEGILIQLKKEGTHTLYIEEKTSIEWFADIINKTLHQLQEEFERQ